MGSVASGNVNFGDPIMLAEILTDIGAAVSNLDETIIDQGLEGTLDEGTEVVIDRIHLQQNDLSFNEEFMHHIQWANAGHVSCAENQGDPALGRRIAIELSDVVHQICLRDFWLLPDLRRETTEQETVSEVGWEDLGYDLSIRAFRDP